MNRLVHAGLSDMGRQHRTNEDRWLADPAQGLYLVADGMADPIAPQIVVDILPALLRDVIGPGEPPSAEAVAGRVRAALTEVNRNIRGESKHRLGRPGGLGTTLVFLLVQGEQALIVHLGDSRAYLHRAGSLTPLTRDHSRAQAMIDRGELTTEEAARYRWNGGPTRFLGMSGELAPDIKVLDLLPFDQLLLCSDGLPEMLRDKEIRAILDRRWPAEAGCQSFIDAANQAGGRDNITALVIQVQPK